jgi:CheY-like chemotaxis protein
MSEGREGSAPERGLVVVVVDDEPDVADYLAAVLERHGHDPHVARSTSEGFALVKELRPDVACIDVVMPEESGVALYCKIRSDPEVADTAVVFISALKHEASLFGQCPSGPSLPQPDAFLEKPPNASALVKTVTAVAAARRRGQ